MDKVIIVIVEGVSDKSLISDRLEEYFEDCEINFAVVGTDVFNRSTTATIKRNINSQIKKLKSVKKFKSSDILCVLHITDTDGCFIKDDLIIIEDTQEKATIYTEENIVVNSESQKSNIKGRNKSKRNNTNVMIPITSINFEKTKVSYQLYYFSRHLEHVLFNNCNPDKKAKVSEVDKFVEALTEDIEVWLSNYLPEFSNEEYNTNFTESWNYIVKDSNSLKRCNNIPLIFKYIDDKLECE